MPVELRWVVSAEPVDLDEVAAEALAESRLAAVTSWHRVAAPDAPSLWSAEPARELARPAEIQRAMPGWYGDPGLGGASGGGGSTVQPTSVTVPANAITNWGGEPAVDDAETSVTPDAAAAPLTGAAVATRKPRRSALRRAASAATTVLSIGLLAFWFIALRPLSLGGQANYTVIHGNSMWPLYKDGDLIVTHTKPAYGVGDVVAYRVPKGEIGAGDLVIHRITGGSTTTGLVLQGDNNPHTDPWHPTFADIAGSTWVQIPRAGRLLVVLHQPLALGVIAMLITVATVLRAKPRKPHGVEATPAETAGAAAGV